MDKISAEYIKSKKENGCKDSEEANSKSHDENMDQYNDSTYQELIYGPNSSLNPDDFIKVVQATLSEHRDLAKEFRRFLPDDIEEDEQSVEKKYNQFVQNMNFEHAGELLDDQGDGDQEKLNGRMKGVT